MKYIKKYEAEEEEYRLIHEYADIKYWIVSTKDPNLEISLKKIPKCTLTRQDFYDFTRRPIFTYDYVYVLFVDSMEQNMDGYDVNRKYWNWLETSPDRWDLSRKFENVMIISKKNKGQIKVTKKDLEKYDLENTISKMNI